MPNIGAFHPQIVHFVIALLIVGVLARVLSLLPARRLAFLSPMATVLILLGTLAALAAAQSGQDAHGPVERVPGARDAVVEHEDWGMRTRNVFIAIAVLELAALALGSRQRLRRALHVVTAVAGLGGLYVLYEAADHGGDLVYAYAGGVGIRSGKTADLEHLLVAGLYHNLQSARREHRKDDAARLTDELVRQMPDDPSARFLAIESQLHDRDDPRGALAALAATAVPENDRRLQIRRATLMVDAYRAAGRADSAQGVIDDLLKRFPNDARMRQAIERMSKPEAAPR